VDLRHDTRRTVPETIVIVLRELGTFLRDLGQSMVTWSDRLKGWVCALDSAYPDWRSMPEAYL
jgi:hypothetical protein